MSDSHSLDAAEVDPPYYAVIFSNQRRASDDGYLAMAQRMEELARQQAGFLGLESVRDATGFGITISYWTDLDAIAAWRAHAEHLVAQQRGRRDWYERYVLRVARVERTQRLSSLEVDR